MNGKENIIEREIDIEKLRQSIGEYLQRMMKIHKEGCGTTTDFLFDCPQCGSFRSMEFRERFWKCLVRKCGEIIPPELAPPSPGEFNEIMRLKNGWIFWKNGKMF